MHRSRNMPFNVLLLAAFIGLQFSLFGQAPRGRVIRVPVYRSAADSVKLYQLEKQISDLRNTTKASAKKLDSLMVLYERQHKVAIRSYRNIYRSSGDHISLDSLSTLPDLSAVTRLSIDNPDLTTLPPEVYACVNLESLEQLLHRKTEAVV